MRCAFGSDSIRSNLVLFLTLLVMTTALWAFEEPVADEGFKMPPPEVEDILSRDRHYDELGSLSPDGSHFVIPVASDFSDYARLGRKTYRLGMLELVPETNQEWRLASYGTGGIRIFSMETRQFTRVDLPEGVLVSDFSWSPDSRSLAFLVHQGDGTTVWSLGLNDFRAAPISDSKVMATLAGRPQRGQSASSKSRLLQWVSNESILTLLVPSNRGQEPPAPALPTTPLIRKTRDKPTPTRTYPFLLRTPHDHELFRYYTTSQMALLKQGEPPRTIGAPGMFMEIALSPDSRHVLAERIEEPFSNIVDYNGFPRVLEVVDLQGETLSTIRKRPLQEALSRGGGPRPDDSLPRDVEWRPDGAGLSLAWREPRKKDSEEENESEDEERPRQDRLMLLAPPFDLEQARVLASSSKRFTRISYSQDGNFAFARLTGRGEGTRDLHDLVAYDLRADEAVRHELVTGIDPKDNLKEPGNIVTSKNGNGVAWALMNSAADAVYLQGQGLREDFRPRPFIDRVRLADGQLERVFEGSDQMYEEPLVALDQDLNRMVINREAPDRFPDSYLWNSGGTSDRLTSNVDPFPEVADCRTINFEYTRRDGLTGYGRITLPVGYREGSRVPAIFWTYPREFADFEEYKTAAIRSRRQNQFRHLNYRNASEIWLTQGYAVVDPDIPIIGKGGDFNNNYIAHLSDSMYAAIRKLDQMGYIDVDRLGHGGHSYGAFATANILAHTPYFKAGIAGDGAYNRTLTPMTFQSERRFLWEALDTILEMSPFFYADHLDTPLLMYHGAVDNNTGTFLIQSERMIQALTGLGKTAVLYIYPHESHGPRAKETYLDMWSRWLDWFDRYVKGSGSDQPQPETGS